MTPAADTTVSKVDLAYDLIRRRILDGAYTPGYRLVLGTLAKALGVSTVPVREAVRRLEAEGLVEVVRNVGATVRGLDPVEYRWTVETLAVVEGAATGMAAARLPATALAEARRLNDAMRDGLADLDPLRHTRLNQQFHRALTDPCPNPHLLDLVERGWTRVAALRSSVFSFVPDRAAESVREHDALLDLIARGAPAAEIDAAARAHREATLHAVLHSQAATASKGPA
ncbi:GntR family transcriptional regulator [Pseudonocardia nigra]|uniref:GntR family transcriptional regulator n=1 Tax=Pseudonocardia nigra TaxID=1921578 RepID=UPI001C5F1142|nr:GntR family transcriptional regulator [Pseudonocardia nigra]